MRVSPAQRSQRSKMGRISTLSEVSHSRLNIGGRSRLQWMLTPSTRVQVHRHGRLGLSTRPNVVTRLPTVQRVAPKVASSGNASSFRDRWAAGACMRLSCSAADVQPAEHQHPQLQQHDVTVAMRVRGGCMLLRATTNQTARFFAPFTCVEFCSMLCWVLCLSKSSLLQVQWQKRQGSRAFCQHHHASKSAGSQQCSSSAAASR